MRLRVIVFDLDQSNRDLVALIVQKRGHEVLSFAEPLACPLYSDAECSCPEERACGDLMIIDSRMIKMTGLEFIKQQQAHGCKGATRNKLVLSATGDNKAELQGAKELGCKIIRKPFKIDDLLSWIDECEQNIDPDRTLADINRVKDSESSRAPQHS